MTTLDQRICPGCGLRPRRVHACAHCGWTADPGKIPTVRELLDGYADGATRTPDVAREWARAVECGVDYTYPPAPLPPIDELADLIREDGGLGETPALALLDEIQRMRKALAAPPTTTTDTNGATP